MKQSYIVIGKNEAENLDRCFESIRKFAAPFDYEIIYVDSQSTDKSLQIASGYTDKTYTLEAPCNAAKARNLGGSHADGDVLVFIDGDMELKEDFRGKAFTEDGTPRYELFSGVFCNYFKINTGDYRKEKKNRSITETVREVDAFGGNFIVMAEIWRALGGMTESMDATEDIDFCHRYYNTYGLKPYFINAHFLNHYTIAYKHVDRFREISYGKNPLYMGRHMRNVFSINILPLVQRQILLVLSLLLTIFFYFAIFLYIAGCMIDFFYTLYKGYQSFSVLGLIRYVFYCVIYDSKFIIGFMFCRSKVD